MEIGIPRKRGNGLLVVLTLAVLLGIGCMIAFYPHEPALLDHATRIAPTANWIQSYGGYFWQSDKAVLAFRPFESSLTALNVGVDTGQETPLIGLTVGWKRTMANEVSNWRLSPDGRLLLWEDTLPSSTRSRPLNARWIASSLDGVKQKSWTASNNSFAPLWFPDNRRWVEAIRSNNGQGTLPIIHDMEGKDIRCAPIQGPFTWPLAVTPEERLLTLEWQQRSGQVLWYEYPLRPESAPSVVTSVTMPKGVSGLIEAELSPQGDRIACLVAYIRLSPLESLLKRFFPDFGPRVQERIALWVFRRDGKDSRLLGVESGRTASGLLWSPDGRRISLYDHDSLYSIPAE
jgi:hypothetical protein